MRWDIQLARRYRAAEGEFALEVAWQSDAQRLVLSGPSGAGKTQLLRLIAGLTRPDAGHVRIAGQTLFDQATGVDLPPSRRRLGLVFQDYALFPHLTVQQNIAFGLFRGWRNPGLHEGAEQVSHWLRTLRLQSVAAHLPHQVSGGQRQRAALARALVTRPAALLLDEPFAALDPPLRRHLRQELRALQAELALPMLLVTHDEQDAEALGDERLTLRAGRLCSAAEAWPGEDA